ncbi:MAG: heme-binding protein [Proteobacteria bacterium]|nr:heme-binding protein [Pseudomonadota bacterium]
MAVKEPAFTLTIHEGAFEVRTYPARVIAETRVTGSSFAAAGNEGFRRLAGYIFGKNRARQRVAMTAPVGEHQEPRKLAMTAPVGEKSEAGAWVITFTMPAEETLDTLPVPDDARVTLRAVPPTRVAVHRFSGRWTDAKYTTKTAALRSWITAQGLSAIGEPEVNRYDPPWMPWFLRRNEIWLTLPPALVSAGRDAVASTDPVT